MNYLCVGKYISKTHLSKWENVDLNNFVLKKGWKGRCWEALACNGVNITGVCVLLSRLSHLDFTLRSKTSKARSFVNASMKSTSAEL